MNRRTPLIVLLTLIVVCPALLAATTTPPVPLLPPPPLILGVEQLSSTGWALLVQCPYPPQDLYIWTKDASLQRPQQLTASEPSRWRAQFTGSLPSMITIYGCGQQAALIITSPTGPSWLGWLFLAGLVVAGLLSVRLVKRWRARAIPLSVPAPAPTWYIHLHDEQGERTVALPIGIFTVGSDPACHLTVFGADIALRHAHLIAGEMSAHIVDLASPSGVFSGPVRRRLRPHTPTPVGEEDFWLGATVRLRLARERDL